MATKLQEISVALVMSLWKISKSKILITKYKRAVAPKVLEIMKNKMPLEKFEMWKKKATANKPKPKPLKIDDFDEDLDGKYYIKNKFD